MVSCHQVLVWPRAWQLLVLHLCLSHVVIARVKVLLLKEGQGSGYCKEPSGSTQLTNLAGRCKTNQLRTCSLDPTPLESSPWLLCCCYLVTYYKERSVSLCSAFQKCGGINGSLYHMQENTAPYPQVEVQLF